MAIDVYRTPDVDEVAWELGVSRATLYRLVAAYRAKRTVSSVEPRSRGRRKNTFVLDRKRENLISRAIREIYLHPERPTTTYLIDVRARCSRAELSPPDRRTIKARVDRIDRRVAALKRKDSKGVKATTAVPGQYFASRPLEVVQIDHTEVDLFLVPDRSTAGHAYSDSLSSDRIPAGAARGAGACLGRSDGAPQSTKSNASEGPTKLRQILPGSEFRTAAGPTAKPSIEKQFIFSFQDGT